MIKLTDNQIEQLKQLAKECQLHYDFWQMHRTSDDLDFQEAAQNAKLESDAMYKVLSVFKFLDYTLDSEE